MRIHTAMKMIRRSVPVALIGFSLIVGAGAQVPSSPESDELNAKCGSQVRSTYLLGPDDQLEISGPELNETVNKPVRVDGDGDIQAPLVAPVHLSRLPPQPPHTDHK